MDLTARVLNLATEVVQPDKSNTSAEEQPEVNPSDQHVHALKQIQKRLSAADILALLEAYQRGRTVAQLSRDHGINGTTVLQHLERHDVPRRPHVRKLTDAQVAKAAQLYAEGWSYSQLGKKYFVNAETVRKELHKAGVASRPPGRPRT